MKTGSDLIAKERMEQIHKHGFKDLDASYYTNGELLQAAKYCLTLDAKDYPETWGAWFTLKVIEKRSRMTDDQFKLEMVKIAGAFCAAEIDRLNRES